MLNKRTAVPAGTLILERATYPDSSGASPWSQTIYFLLIYPWRFPSCCLRAESQKQWVCQEVILCAGPLRGTPGNPAVLLTQIECPQILAAFMGTPLPGIGSLGWGAPCGVGIPCSSEGPCQLRYLSQILTATCGCGASLFSISTSPISLVVPSLYPL